MPSLVAFSYLLFSRLGVADRHIEQGGGGDLPVLGSRGNTRVFSRMATESNMLHQDLHMAAGTLLQIDLSLLSLSLPW